MGDRSGALTEWAHCLTDDALCQGYLAMNTPHSSTEPAPGRPRTIAAGPATRGYVNALQPGWHASQATRGRNDGARPY